MRMNKEKVENFIELWCNFLNLPQLDFKIVTREELDDDTLPDDQIIYAVKDIYKSKSFCNYVIFHEIIHCYLKKAVIGAIYKNENIVELITNELFETYYPKQWRELCSKKLI